MRRSDQLKYIGKAKLNAISKINKILGKEFQLIGSFSLLAYEVIKRKIGDLGIAVPDINSTIKSLESDGVDGLVFFDKDAYHKEHNGKRMSKIPNLERIIEDITFIRVYINDVKIDIFENHHAYSRKVDLKGIGEVVVAHPRYAMSYKRIYILRLKLLHTLSFKDVKTLIKHNKDIKAYKKWKSKL